MLVLAVAAAAAIVAIVATWLLLRPGRDFVVYSDAEFAAIENIHDHEGRSACQACHRGRRGKLLADPVSVCMRECHSFHLPSHPVLVVQDPAVGEDLPLIEGNLMVCHTCHDPHDLKHNPHGLRLPFSELCLRCHPGH